MNRAELDDIDQSPSPPDSLPSFDPYKELKTAASKVQQPSGEPTIERLRTENTYLKQQLRTLDERLSLLSQELLFTKTSATTTTSTTPSSLTAAGDYHRLPESVMKAVKEEMFQNDDLGDDDFQSNEPDDVHDDAYLTSLYGHRDADINNTPPPTSSAAGAALAHYHRVAATSQAEEENFFTDDWFKKATEVVGRAPVWTLTANSGLTTTSTSSSTSSHHHQPLNFANYATQYAEFAPQRLLDEKKNTSEFAQPRAVFDPDDEPPFGKRRRRSVSNLSDDDAKRLYRKTSLEPEQDITGPKPPQAHHIIKPPERTRGRRPQAKNQNNQSRKFQCETCGQWMRDKYNLLHHMMVHTGDRPYKCPLCERGFSRINLRRQHMEQEHGVPMVKYSRQHTFDAIVEEAKRKQAQGQSTSA